MKTNVILTSITEHYIYVPTVFIFNPPPPKKKCRRVIVTFNALLHTQSIGAWDKDVVPVYEVIRTMMNNLTHVIKLLRCPIVKDATVQGFLGGDGFRNDLAPINTLTGSFPKGF